MSWHHISNHNRPARFNFFQDGLLIGPTGTGKTNFANRYFGNNATKVINLDEVLTRVAKGTYHPVSFYRRVRDLYDPNNLLVERI
jgi:hypothetical protein